MEEKKSKRIELCKMKCGDIKTGFGNPRKIGKKQLDELKNSIEKFGDFGIFLIDETDNIIAGNQRLRVLVEIDPDTEVTCKRMIGYSDIELKAINIKDNTHSGEWDFDLLAEWTADIGLDIEMVKNDVVERKIDEMEPIPYEHYDYVMIVCRSELDYNDLLRKLGLENMKVKITPKRKIKARAIWYDKMPVDFVEKEVDHE